MLDWKIPGPAPDALLAAIEKTNPDIFAAAVEREGRVRVSQFLDGIETYRAHPYIRDLEDPPAVATDGSTQLLHFDVAAPSRKATLFVIPSLINRSYVLDLSTRSSFMRWLAANGHEGYLVDWGRPGDEEREFDLTEYVAGRLEKLFTIARARTAGPVVVLGYCMGGNLALALALRRQAEIDGLAVLATPWDIHAAGVESAQAIAAIAVGFEPQLEALGELSTDVLQLLFCALDPLLGFRKFQNFASLDPNSSRAMEFVSLEDWLNDGVPLVARVARECLGGWYGRNDLATGNWRIAGETVDPRELRIPALAMIPMRDRIVPPESATGLATALPNCETVSPRAGHIGMMAGHNAEKLVWQPLVEWMAERQTAQ